MSVAGLIIAATLGIIIGCFFRMPEQECPQRIMGYPHKGENCDHSDSLRYEALMHQALSRERRGGGGTGHA